MLQYLPPIALRSKKDRNILNNHAAFAARFSKCFRLLRSITQYENVLCWLDNDFVLTRIKTAYVTFAFRSKPCCNVFLKFNIRVFCFYVLW